MTMPTRQEQAARAAEAELTRPFRALLAQAGGEAVDLIWQEQRRQWLAGEPVPAERYLAALGPGRSAEERFDVVYGEVALRAELGLMPALSEFQQRFPEFAAELARQWLFDSAADHLDASSDVPGGQEATIDSQSSTIARPHPPASAYVTTVRGRRASSTAAASSIARADHGH